MGPLVRGLPQVSSKPKVKADDAPAPGILDSAVWILLAIAALATAYFLMREPEDSFLTPLAPAMRQARAVGLGASLLGALPGICRIVTRRGDPNLFAMAVLFNILLASYWTLRITLG